MSNLAKSQSFLRSLARAKFDHDSWVSTPEEVRVRQPGLPSRVDRFKAVGLGQVGHDDLQVSRGHRLARANSLTSVPGREGTYMSLFARRGQAEFTVVVKALGQKLVRTLPLTRVAMEAIHVDTDFVSGSEKVVTKLHVCSADVGGGRGSRRVVPGSLVEDAAQVLKVLSDL